MQQHILGTTLKPVGRREGLETFSGALASPESHLRVPILLYHYTKKSKWSAVITFAVSGATIASCMGNGATLEEAQSALLKNMSLQKLSIPDFMREEV